MYFWEAVVILVILRWSIAFEKNSYILGGRYYGYCNCFSVPHKLLGKSGWLFAGWCLWWYLPCLAEPKSQEPGGGNSYRAASYMRNEGSFLFSSVSEVSRALGRQFEWVLLIFWPGPAETSGRSRKPMWRGEARLDFVILRKTCVAGRSVFGLTKGAQAVALVGTSFRILFI